MIIAENGWIGRIVQRRYLQSMIMRDAGISMPTQIVSSTTDSIIPVAASASIRNCKPANPE